LRLVLALVVLLALLEAQATKEHAQKRMAVF
jgi:hypothetical protein